MNEPSAVLSSRWQERMNQSRTGYYADLFFYPVVVVGFLLYDLTGRGLSFHPRWWLALLCGAMVWTLAEYLLHRFVYHEVAIIRDLHGMHHSHPNDFVGSPVWVSLAGFAALLGLLSLLLDFEIACGITSGLMLGYLSYLLVHDAVHRWHLGERSWMRNYRLRHLRHHRHPSPGNFGVTTGFWDHVFGTEIVPERTRGPKPVEAAE
jgi:sterol desaturase/sphingolipid hydroxylase (fatty acid hydroxylase superfamily)